MVYLISQSLHMSLKKGPVSKVGHRGIHLIREMWQWWHEPAGSQGIWLQASEVAQS